MRYKLRQNIMALEIKSPPVLYGKAVREFHKRAAEANKKYRKVCARAMLSCHNIVIISIID